MMTTLPKLTRRALTAGISALLLSVSINALAQPEAFPTRPIRMIVPTAAGGNIDILARILAEHMSKAWGQQVVVDSKPGANSMLATTAVARSPADGYTVLMTLSGFVQNLVLQPNPPYKVNDLVPVSQVAWFPVALAANAKLPATDVASVVKLAKAQPDKLSFGSYGVGSGGHIIGEGLNNLAGIRIKHVGYKGESPAFTDLVGGNIELAYGSVGFYAHQLSGGKVRLIAVASPNRLKTFPNVPTFAEAGYPEINIPGWGGVFLPAKTPPAIVEKYTQEIRRIVALPEVQKKILEMGFEPTGTTSAQFSDLISSDIKRWGKIVRDNNIKLE
ncbi:Bug family tripartite tricarboxylate transporter substrate binding protein [Cupriavidus metallidurans]|nr:tripartite tricarboxylate transporter substrate binding protein [Cupriavidus metallidurans]